MAAVRAVLNANATDAESRITELVNDTAFGAAFTWSFETSTSTPPSSQSVNCDTGNMSTATELRFDDTVDSGIDTANFGERFFSIGDTLFVQDRDDSANYVTFSIESFTQNSGYYTIGVSKISESGTIFDSQKCYVVKFYGSVVTSGTTANRPAERSGFVQLYRNTTSGEWEWSIGSGWTAFEAAGTGAFTKYEVGVADSPYTMPSWGAVYEIHNDTADIELILPSADTASIGKEVKLWVEHNPANHKIILKSPDTSHQINGVAADGSDVARAEFHSNHANYFRVTAQSIAENEVYVDGADTVYNTQRYVMNFSATSDFSPYSYLELSAIPTNFLTDNADWWFAVKIEEPMRNDSDGQVLFGSNNAFIAYQGNGAYLMTHSTSGYLQTVSPNTIIESGEWIIYQYDSSTNYYTAWINGVKVLSATSSGVTMPTTAPTNMWFGSETGQASPPSGYGYPLQTCTISNISIGSGFLSDADAALFTTSVFDTSGLVLSGGTLTNQWAAAASNTITTVTGSINMTIAGSNLTTEEL